MEKKLIRKAFAWAGSVLAAAVLVWLLSLIPGEIVILAPADRTILQPTAAAEMIIPTNTPGATANAVQATSGIPTPSPTPSLALFGEWAQISSRSAFPPVAITTLTGDPNDPHLLYAGTQGAGIFISTDAGQTWTASNRGLGKGLIGQIVINPLDSRVIYASLLEQGGVYRSIDAGQSWQAALTGINLDMSWQHTGLLASAQSTSDVLFFSDTIGGVYRSRNGGQSWFLRSSRCPPATGIVIDPSNSDHVLVPSFDDNLPDCPAGIYESIDGATTWKRLTSDEMTKRGVGDWWQLAVDVGDLRIMYASGYSGTYQTLDGGGSWRRIQERCDWIAVRPISGTVFCKREEQLWISRDRGITWDESSRLARWSGQGSAPIVFDAGLRAIYVGGNEVQKSLDDGESWQGFGRLGAARMDLNIDPTDENRLFLTMLDKPAQVLRSENGGATWQVILEGIDSGGELTVNSQGVLYYPGPGEPNSGLYRSVNSGDTWEVIRLDHPEIKPRRLLVNPTNSEHLWVASECGSGLFASFDGGRTFRKKEEEPNDLCQPILITDDAGEWVYVIQWGQTFRSMDGGETWEKLSSPGGIIISAALDLDHPEIIYIGSTHKGVLKSIDGGQTWQEMNNGLGNLAINDIAIVPSDSRTIYVGTDEGIFVSVDGGNHWQNLPGDFEGNSIIYSLELDPQNPSLIYVVTPNGVYRTARK